MDLKMNFKEKMSELENQALEISQNKAHREETFKPASGGCFHNIHAIKVHWQHKRKKYF